MLKKGYLIKIIGDMRDVEGMGKGILIADTTKKVSSTSIVMVRFYSTRREVKENRTTQKVQD